MHPFPLVLATAAPVGAFAAIQNVFDRGGFAMWLLLICSLVATTITIERLLVFGRNRRATARGAAAVDQVLALTSAGRFDEAETQARHGAGMACRILALGLHHRDLGLHDSLEEAANAELDYLRRSLAILDTIITLGPLLGILGTVTGIIRSFHVLGVGDTVDPTVVTGGIAEALLSTAAGLGVAIFALIPFNFFVAKVRQRARTLEHTIHQFEMAYGKGKQTGEAVRLKAEG
jgi:biopolymer transport protein ExbB